MSSPTRPRTGPFADIPPITDFESCQRVRPLLMHRAGDVVGVWRYCGSKSCLRRKSCRRGDARCFITYMRALPPEELLFFRYALEHRSAGLEPAEAIRLAHQRVAERLAQLGD